MFAADENDKNEVVVKVLQLLASLVKFGYYKDTESTKEIFQALLQLLDGRNDYPTKRIKDTLEKCEDIMIPGNTWSSVTNV